MLIVDWISMLKSVSDCCFWEWAIVRLAEAIIPHLLGNVIVEFGESQSFFFYFAVDIDIGLVDYAVPLVELVEEFCGVFGFLEHFNYWFLILCLWRLTKLIKATRRKLT